MEKLFVTVDLSDKNAEIQALMCWFDSQSIDSREAAALMAATIVPILAALDRRTMHENIRNLADLMHGLADTLANN